MESRVVGFGRCVRGEGVAVMATTTLKYICLSKSLWICLREARYLHAVIRYILITEIFITGYSKRSSLTVTKSKTTLKATLPFSSEHRFIAFQFVVLLRPPATFLFWFVLSCPDSGAVGCAGVRHFTSGVG